MSTLPTNARDLRGRYERICQRLRVSVNLFSSAVIVATVGLVAGGALEAVDPKIAPLRAASVAIAGLGGVVLSLLAVIVTRRAAVSLEKGLGAARVDFVPRQYPA